MKGKNFKNALAKARKVSSTKSALALAVLFTAIVVNSPQLNNATPVVNINASKQIHIKADDIHSSHIVDGKINIVGTSYNSGVVQEQFSMSDIENMDIPSLYELAGTINGAGASDVLDKIAEKMIKQKDDIDPTTLKMMITKIGSNSNISPELITKLSSFGKEVGNSIAENFISTAIFFAKELPQSIVKDVMAMGSAASLLATELIKHSNKLEKPLKKSQVSALEQIVKMDPSVLSSSERTMFEEKISELKNEQRVNTGGLVSMLHTQNQNTPEPPSRKI